MLEVNYTGVFLAAQACAREMLKYKIAGLMCLVASMSGTIANRGLDAPVYNSSKAAVVQLARNLAMEFGRKRPDGSGGMSAPQKRAELPMASCRACRSYVAALHRAAARARRHAGRRIDEIPADLGLAPTRPHVRQVPAGPLVPLGADPVARQAGRGADD